MTAIEVHYHMTKPLRGTEFEFYRDNANQVKG